ncbi:hypothetical protein N8I77_002775 [Diaporthe amygdali]|uniref:G domain-containing protein n=1 Tax=Phomopsis amygdali TaxID=1214568 RepID=A0AAD9W9N3_PHOAM|nr:hypothetical protein N8I77_002775 [Diaporthe amygdali]
MKMEDLKSLNLDSFHLPPEPLEFGLDDLIIAVMGVTGAGKSTFISHCTSGSQGPSPDIGHGVTSRTREVAVYKCDYAPGTSFYLVDTPGFDDTSRTDKQVLQNITEWLGTTYKQGVKLNGIVYFHRISDRRMTGSARKNLHMFSKLCGEEAFSKVILATTMREDVKPADGERREKELTETKDFWGFMCEKGSHVFRHYNSKKSAMELLSYFADDKTQKVTLDVQRELVEGRKTLDETRVGKELDSAFAAERERLKEELKQLEQELKETIRGQNEEMADLIRESQQEVRHEMEIQIRQLQRDRDELKVTLDDLREQSRNFKAKITTSPSTRATLPSSSIRMPQHSVFHDATTRIRCGYAGTDLSHWIPSYLTYYPNALLTWSGNHFMFALQQHLNEIEHDSLIKPIQILPTESNSPHRIREQDALLDIAEIVDDHNYIISGINLTYSCLRHPAEWFLKLCFRDYPKLPSWVNAERDLDEETNQSGTIPGSLYAPSLHGLGSGLSEIFNSSGCSRLTFLSLGPNGTYYVQGYARWERPEPLKGRISYELPQSLMSDTSMAERLTTWGTQVWLGRHGSWVVHWYAANEHHRSPRYREYDVKWHLNDVGLYPGLERFLRTYKAFLDGTENVRPQILLRVSFYSLTPSIPASSNALGRQRALAIRQRNNC